MLVGDFSRLLFSVAREEPTLGWEHLRKVKSALRAGNHDWLVGDKRFSGPKPDEGWRCGRMSDWR